MLLLNAPVDAEPLVVFVPDQPPEAVQLVALVLDQLSVEDCPDVIAAGLAEIETVGADGLVTVTDALALVEPPAPVHVSV